MCDYGPPSDDCDCHKPKPKKTDRRCNNCGQYLTDNAPNWFQCSEACRAEVYARNHPRREED